MNVSGPHPFALFITSASTVKRGNVRAGPWPVAGRFRRLTATRTAAPVIPSSAAVADGVNESPAGSATGAASRRREVSQSAARAASASRGNMNPHPESSAVMRPVVRRT